MKKKVLAISAVLAVVAIILSAGTLAYFSDTDTATNTFTLGKVDIELIETDHLGNAFQQDQKLMPGDAKTTAVPKEVTVKVDDASEDAYVWVEVLIPSDLYGSKTDAHETNNALHYNQFVNFLQGYTSNSPNPNAITASGVYAADHQWTVMKYIDEVTVDGKSYSRLRTTHKDIVKAGKTTSPAMSQVYLDDDVKYEDGKYMIPVVTEGTDTIVSYKEYTGDWEIVVNAYAVQAEGLADVDAAVAAYNE